jgi:hypothetical protein
MPLDVVVAVAVTWPRRRGTAAHGAGDRHDHPMREAAHEDAAGDRAGGREEQEDAEDVRDEARREQQGAAEDDEHAVEHLARRHAAGAHRGVEAPPRGATLRAHEPGAEQRVADQQGDRPPDADGLADLDDDRQLGDRHDQEEEEKKWEHRCSQSRPRRLSLAKRARGAVRLLARPAAGAGRRSRSACARSAGRRSATASGPARGAAGPGTRGRPSARSRRTAARTGRR